MAFFSGLLFCLFCLSFFFSVVHGGGHKVNITILKGAVGRGAVCLDGSPRGYYLDAGCGGGANNWVIFLEGSGWCQTKRECVNRAKQNTGSTLLRKEAAFFAGILDNNATFNPYYYNWNRVQVAYCDGASFLGDVEEVDPETKLYYRGSRVFDAVID